MKIAEVTYRDITIKQIVLETKSDIDEFFIANKKTIFSPLKEKFEDIVSKSGKVLLSLKPHQMTGFHTWRTEGKEDYKIIKYID